MEPVEEVLDEGSLDQLYNLMVGFWEPREIVIKGKGEVVKLENYEISRLVVFSDVSIEHEWEAGGGPVVQSGNLNTSRWP